MSKSILMIDTPECCCQCKFSGADGDYCCLKEDMVSDSNMISEEEYMNKKPDWCPLLDLPEKKSPKKFCNVINGRKVWGFHMPGFNKGYNACIDEILKGANGNE